MIIIDDILVSEELFDIHFICDLTACKGACCVEGDAGAPLEEEEVSKLEDALEAVRPYMTGEGRKSVEKQGVFVYDDDGTLVTPLNNGKECAFTYFVGREARCAIEKAWAEGKTSFRKPESCHLYPIRIKKLSKGEAVNYHQWHICAPALVLGKKKGVPVFRFLKDSLIRRYGKEWYEKLEIAYRELRNKNA